MQLRRTSPGGCVRHTRKHCVTMHESTHTHIQPAKVKDTLAVKMGSCRKKQQQSSKDASLKNEEAADTGGGDARAAQAALALIPLASTPQLLQDKQHQCSSRGSSAGSRVWSGP